MSRWLFQVAGCSLPGRKVAPDLAPQKWTGLGRHALHVSGDNLALIMRLLTGSSAPRRWADATIAIMGLHYPVNHQTAVLLDCLVVIDGPCRGARLGIEVVMLNP